MVIIEIKNHWEWYPYNQLYSYLTVQYVHIFKVMSLVDVDGTFPEVMCYKVTQGTPSTPKKAWIYARKKRFMLLFLNDG